MSKKAKFVPSFQLNLNSRPKSSKQLYVLFKPFKYGFELEATAFFVDLYFSLGVNSDRD